MRLPSPWIVVLMLCWPATAKAAPPQTVPEGAGFPVQRLIEAVPPSVVPQDAIPPPTMPESVSFPCGDIIGLPIVTMPEALPTALADEGEELLRWVLAGDVLFDFDKSEIRTDGEEDLEAFLDRLDELKGFTLTVEGHTDSKGTDAYTAICPSVEQMQWLPG